MFLYYVIFCGVLEIYFWFSEICDVYVSLHVSIRDIKIQSFGASSDIFSLRFLRAQKSHGDRFRAVFNNIFHLFIL